MAKQKGARRVVPLRVSIASHCSLMESAARGLREALARVVLREGSVPVVGNVTGKPLRSADEVREELVKQLVSPVLWVDSVRYMLDHGVTAFAEIGPKDVLSNLIKRIDRGPERASVGDVASIEAWYQERSVQHGDVSEE